MDDPFYDGSGWRCRLIFVIGINLVQAEELDQVFACVFFIHQMKSSVGGHLESVFLHICLNE